MTRIQWNLQWRWVLLGHAREREEGRERERGASNSTLCRLTFFSRPKLASLFNRGKGECNFVTVLSPWQPFHPLSVLRLIGDRRGGDHRQLWNLLLPRILQWYAPLSSNWYKIPLNLFEYLENSINFAYFVSKIGETIISSFRKLNSWFLKSGDSKRVELFVPSTRFETTTDRSLEDANSKWAARIGREERMKRENEEDALHACARVEDANSLKQITYARA